MWNSIFKYIFICEYFIWSLHWLQINQYSNIALVILHHQLHLIIAAVSYYYYFSPSIINRFILLYILIPYNWICCLNLKIIYKVFFFFFSVKFSLRVWSSFKIITYRLIKIFTWKNYITVVYLLFPIFRLFLILWISAIVRQTSFELLLCFNRRWYYFI